MQAFSSVPILIAVQLGFVAWIAGRARRRGALAARESLAIYALLAQLVLWALVTASLARAGAYASPRFHALLPGLWLQLVPVAICGLNALAPSLRSAVAALLRATPSHWLIGIHALRIAALGTLWKTHAGEFPLYFELGVGVPDLLFGLSAPFVALTQRRGSLSVRARLLWHIVGVLVILPAAAILLQLGLPGPLQVFTTVPASEVLFAWPMALAPTFVVPFFVALNLVCALFEAQRR